MVDDYVARTNTFRRWEFTYDSLDKFSSPEPAAFGGELPVIKQGIYLRWILPRALRTRKEGEADFPLIPNRWRITRSEGGEEKSWILESDCPLSTAMEQAVLEKMRTRASRYFITAEIKGRWEKTACPYRGNPALKAAPKGSGGYFVNLGVFSPAEAWEEKAGDILFLTANAPGNPAFSAYTVHNSNMLSFYDDMEGVGSGRHEFSYSLTGWYSNQREGEHLEGRITGVLWQEGGLAPQEYRDDLGEIRQHGRLNVAVGESPEDTFRGYVRQRLSYKTPQELGETDQILAALFHHMLDYRQAPDGFMKLKNALHDQRFEAKSGGTRYIIVEEDEGPALLTKEEQELLEELNGFDERVMELNALRERLFFLWWKRGKLSKLPIVTVDREPEDFDEALDYAEEESLMHRTVGMYEQVRELFQRMPGKDENCRLYGKKRGVEQGKVLKAVPAPRYWRQVNPSILINGAEVPKDVEVEETQKKIGDTVWHQPWSPLFAEWKVTYTRIPYDGSRQSNWIFDGTDYRLRENYVPAESWGFGGISMLDSHQKYMLLQALEDVLQDGQADQQESGELLLKQAYGLASWKMTGQELANLKDMMAQRDYRAFRRPIGKKIPGCLRTLEEVLGFEAEEVGFLERTGGRLECAPLAWGEVFPDFMELQSGILQITDLALYDAFGRMLNLIRSGEYGGYLLDKNFPLAIPPKLRLQEKNHILLKPRFLQFARLEIDFRKCRGDNPVCGFVAVNHLDRSLAAYGPSGERLGKLSCRISNGQRRVCYIPAPEGRADTLEGLKEEYPELAGVLEAMTQWEDESFDVFLDAVDKAVWTMASSGGQRDINTFMTGRPLAVVQAAIFLRTWGKPWGDIGWEDTGEEEMIAEIYKSGKIPVRLGDLTLQNDGLAGYFENDNYQRFYSTVRPGKESSQVVQIGPVGSGKGTYLEAGFGNERAVWVTLLLEPESSLHGYTGILPVKEINIPRAYVEQALKEMDMEFTAGPYISRIGKADAGHAIQIPRMLERKGTWHWLRRQKETWEVLQTQPDTGKAEDREEALSSQEGILRFTSEKGEKEHE